MQLSHAPGDVSAVFDDPNLVSCAGLAPVVALAQRCGLAELIAGKLTLPPQGGANAHLKVPALVAGMVAGAGLDRWHGPAAAWRDGPVVHRRAGAVDDGDLPADVHLRSVGDRAELWSSATQAAAQAAEQVRQHSSSAAAGDLASAGDAAAAAAEVLTAASRLIEGDDGGPLTRAARDYDRAAREVRGRLSEPTVAGSLLRTAALQMARGTRSHRSEAAQILMLVAQIGRLSQSVAALREAQGRSAQAAAARRAALQVGDAAEHWSAESRDLVAAAQRGRAAVVRPPASSTSSKRRSAGPAGPAQGPARGR